MVKSRCSREYRDECRSFVDFAVRNCKFPNGKIHCPGKACRNNQHHLLGKGIMTTYKNWYYHGDKLVRLIAIVSNLTTMSTDAGRSTEPGEHMHAMLRDIFIMHDVRIDNCGPQVVVQGDEENVNVEGVVGDVLKYQDLLKKAEKPLHTGTKHSKPSAIVHLYNLKCVGGVNNTTFSSFLEFINELPANDEALPMSTYEAKKFLRDMGLRYEKISSCHNNCRLF
jgi:hypothetical protein